MGKKFQKNKRIRITIPMQKWHLRIKYKELLIKDNSNKKLDMDFFIKSSTTNNEYIVKIQQEKMLEVPKVFVLFPKLETRSNEKIPHTYGMHKINGKDYLQLCPFYPKEDWNSKMIIADTVFLWTAEWFYFYEIWLVSGKWCGRRKTSRS